MLSVSVVYEYCVYVVYVVQGGCLVQVRVKVQVICVSSRELV